MILSTPLSERLRTLARRFVRFAVVFFAFLAFLLTLNAALVSLREDNSPGADTEGDLLFVVVILFLVMSIFQSVLLAAISELGGSWRIALRWIFTGFLICIALRVLLSTSSDSYLEAVVIFIAGVIAIAIVDQTVQYPSISRKAREDLSDTLTHSRGLLDTALQKTQELQATKPTVEGAALEASQIYIEALELNKKANTQGTLNRSHVKELDSKIETFTQASDTKLQNIAEKIGSLGQKSGGSNGASTGHSFCTHLGRVFTRLTQGLYALCQHGLFGNRRYRVRRLPGVPQRGRMIPGSSRTAPKAFE